MALLGASGGVTKALVVITRGTLTVVLPMPGLQRESQAGQCRRVDDVPAQPVSNHSTVTPPHNIKVWLAKV
jgi:hypothetical protein